MKRIIRNPLKIALIVSSALLSACAEQSAETLSPLPLPVVDANQVKHADYLTRDVRDDNFYFVLPDRFYNANPDNDMGSEELKVSQGGLDVTSKWAFHGGDIGGLEKKLDYLQGLGITAIWMTPILRNQAIQAGGFGHHGYWIVDFSEIDPHFGGNAELKSLIEQAHKRDIKIFFDIITNHTADIIRYKECHHDDGSFKDSSSRECKFKSSQQLASGDRYTPFIPEHLQGVKTPDWLNDPKYYNNQGDSFWQGESAINGDFSGLDDLNTRLPEVVSGMTDIYKQLISEFKPDGFRIDTVKHVDMSFWQTFGPEIVDHAHSLNIPNFHIFGEVYGADPALLSNYTTTGKLPSVLDFGFQSAAFNVFYQDKPVEVINTLFANDDYYSDADSQADLLMNFLGNHDMGRTGHFIQKHLPDRSGAEQLRRSELSHVFMYLSRGVPVIYYGDEQGFTGDGGDVDAREDMFASQVEVYNDNVLLGTSQSTADDNFNTQHPLYQTIKALADFRAAHPALRYGVTLNRETGNHKVVAFSRVDPQEQREYLVVINTSNTPQTVLLDKSADKYQHLAGDNNYSVTEQVSVSLAPLSYSVIKAETPLPVASTLDVSVASVSVSEQRVIVEFQLPAGNDAPLALKTLTLMTASENQASVIAVDHAAPYRLIVTPEVFSELQQNSINAVVSNAIGKQKSTTLSLSY